MRQRRCERHGLWIGLVVLLLGVSWAQVAQAQIKVGVVDLQAVLDQSVRGKSAKDRLKDLGDKLQQDIKSKRDFKEQKEEELQKMRSELKSQGLVLTDPARNAKDEEFRKRVRELKRFIDDTNRFIEDATQEFREREVRETQSLIGSVRRVVQEIGKREGYNLILEGNESTALVLYFNEAVDLTARVVQRFDQTSAADTPATPPAAPPAAPPAKKR